MQNKSESILNKIQEQKKFINQEFKITDSDMWFLNKEWNEDKFKPNFRVGFSFDDAELISQCPFYAKVGLALDGKYKYYGIAYGNNTVNEYSKEKLLDWVKKFPESEFFDKLSDYGRAVKKFEQ